MMKSVIKGVFKRGLFHRSLVALLCLSTLVINSMGQTAAVSAREAGAKNASAESAAAAPEPIILAGSPNCAKLNQNNPNDPRFDHITTDYELRLNFAPPTGDSGPYLFTSGGPAGMQRFVTGPEDPNNSVRILNRLANMFNWTSTKGISAVIVGGMDKANVYVYPQAAFADTNLMTADSGQQPLSYISFCFFIPARVTIVKEVTDAFDQTSSSQEFLFTATNLGTPNFTLVDDDAGPGVDTFTNGNVYSFGPGNAVTVTEGSMLGLGWTLEAINCTETAGGGGIGTGGVVFPNLPNQSNTTTNLTNRRATIVLEQGENVTCTFRNRQFTLLAANASVSGRVVTESGLPIRRATVSIFNASTLETKTVQTNSFGFFRFNDLPVGNFYIVTVNHGKRSFPNNTHAFTLDSDLSGVNFTANY
jgi:hypothetical protein